VKFHEKGSAPSWFGCVEPSLKVHLKSSSLKSIGVEPVALCLIAVVVDASKFMRPVVMCSKFSGDLIQEAM